MSRLEVIAFPRICRTLRLQARTPESICLHNVRLKGMTVFKKELCAPASAYALIGLGGLLLHIRIHPPSLELFNWLPPALGALNIAVLPILFQMEKTVAWAYLLAILTVLAGTVGMSYESISTWAGPVTLQAVLLNSTLPDILILWAKLPLAHAMLRHWRPAGAGVSGQSV